MTGKVVFITNITSGITVGIANKFDSLDCPILLNSAYKSVFETSAQVNALVMSFFKFKILELESDVRGRLRKMNFNGINI
jgi:hypothetical protein